MKVALYARVSTKDKEQNPETQLVKLREFCSNRNFQIYKEYIDICSGANWNRPSLKELMKDARRRKFQAVILTKIDRFGRSVIDLAESLNNFQTWKIDFVCVDQPIDTTIPSGKFLYYLLSAVAEFERELIRDRVKDGMKRAKDSGKRLGRPKKEIDEQEVLALYDKHKSTRKVGEHLGVSHVLVYRVLQKHPEKFQSNKFPKNDVSNRHLKLTGEQK